MLLNVLCDRWRQMGHWGHDPDEHFIVVNNVDSEVLLDTIYRGWLHHPEKSMGLLQVVLNIREQQRRNFSDTFKTDSGEALLGTFRNTDPTRQKARNWLLGIYRSRRFAGIGKPVQRVRHINGHVRSRDARVAVADVLHVSPRTARSGACRRGRARLAAIVQDSEDAIFAQTFDGTIISWNRGAELLFGYTQQEAVGRLSAEIIPSERFLEEKQTIEQIQRSEPADERTVETVRNRKDGSAVHILQTISPVKDDLGRDIGVSVIARDITDRKNLEREVLESAAREQQRIGRELHDSLGQELTGLSYLAKSLQQKLSAGENPHAQTAQTIASGIQQALRGVRSAVQGLVPVEVDASGFMVALEKLVAQTQSHCGIDCRIDSLEPVEIDDNVLATNLYRIVQEAINNAVKHSHARQIVVRPETFNGTLSVTVEDDGVGIAEHSRQNGGMGLRIMQYRAGVIDAALDVHSTTSGGTAVVCLVKNHRSGLDS